MPLSEVPNALEESELDAQLETTCARSDSRRFADHEERLRYELSLTDREVGSSPTQAGVRRALGDDPGVLSLDRWLFEWSKTNSFAQAVTTIRCRTST